MCNIVGNEHGYLRMMTDLTSGTATPLFQKVLGLTSITKDPLTGKIFLSGNINGQGWVKEVCGNGIKDISILPILICITGGPCGVIALNSVDNSHRTLSDCRTYTKINQLPTPYYTFDGDGYVFTQEKKGKLYVIDAKDNYYTQIV